MGFVGRFLVRGLDDGGLEVGGGAGVREEEGACVGRYFWGDKMGIEIGYLWRLDFESFSCGKYP